MGGLLAPLPLCRRLRPHNEARPTPARTRGPWPARCGLGVLMRPGCLHPLLSRCTRRILWPRVLCADTVRAAHLLLPARVTPPNEAQRRDIELDVRGDILSHASDTHVSRWRDRPRPGYRNPNRTTAKNMTRSPDQTSSETTPHSRLSLRRERWQVPYM
jgi:hypothetical protein